MVSTCKQELIKGEKEDYVTEVNQALFIRGKKKAVFHPVPNTKDIEVFSSPTHASTVEKAGHNNNLSSAFQSDSLVCTFHKAHGWVHTSCCLS